MANVLELNNLTMDFGGLRAVDSVDLKMESGQITALIGPNGAGKTTIFNCITGIYVPTKGKVLISPDGKKAENITGLAPHRITKKGLARTFQNIRLFPNMTVLENVMIGMHCRLKSGLFSALAALPKERAEENKLIDDCYYYLDKLELAGSANELAKNLPYGAQRRLEIARALATKPFVLFLDEPAAGMNPQETKNLERLIRKILAEGGLSILLIEHDMSLVMSISDNIYVLDYGQLIAQGDPAAVKANPAVIKAYLGEDADA